MKITIKNCVYPMWQRETAESKGYRPVAMHGLYVLFRNSENNEVVCYWPDCNIYLPSI